MITDIAANVLHIRERIQSACVRVGRDASEIELMAVSKARPLLAVEEAHKQEISLFGENRVQEGIEKFASFKLHNEETASGNNVEIHLIGSLQRNKAKTAADFFHCIQSVDRLSLVEELGPLTLGRAYPLMILFEYHTGEESKSGFPDLDSLFRAAEKALTFPGLNPAGLMTIAPFTADTQAIRTSFRLCYNAREELKKRFPERSWPCLSMGMSGDFEIALEEGSTLVRIGTAIFGEARL
ncbi:MAG: YggS family pyridoxal phosphate-dependent enzyme [Treponema sp.]|jgi:pyridoxal phosphate enzyme (YggS family)|nr:YggS family pyridoxal phosphate-dependent enzyme [Treponema sp.]